MCDPDVGCSDEPDCGIEDQRGATIFGETRDRLETIGRGIADSKVEAISADPRTIPACGAAISAVTYFGVGYPGKSKGCDIGYALAASSCEEANSVDACTITALDATTAFAVPNPNCPSQSQSVFSGLVARLVTLLS
jgi:hypothetical protein